MIHDSLKDSDLLRMLYAGKFDISVTINNIKDHLIWKNNEAYHKLNEMSFKFLVLNCFIFQNEGAIYIHGTDRHLRPIIILNADKFDPIIHTDEMIV